MVDSIKASEQGLRIVDQARQKKRWNKTAEAWCIRGFTSRATLSRFWAGQSIRKEIFIAICEAVGANWQEVADWGETYSVALVKSEVETSDSLTPDPALGRVEKQIVRFIQTIAKIGETHQKPIPSMVERTS
ncbi:MAG: hypothetical protein HC769_35995 [Cyanobacteria bacterium CRU_2_1]|nr:hypothetical protein [Cyanobacteria bacterium CRU_2_1]